MDDPEDDPWGTPDLHKNHIHNGIKPNGTESNGHASFGTTPEPVIAPQPASQPPAETPASTISRETGPSAGAGWGYFDGSGAGAGAGFNQPSQDPVASPFGSNPGIVGVRDGGLGGSGGPARTPSSNPAFPQARSLGGRTGSSVEENILVTLMPEKEGLFMFQHHNYEVSSQRKGNKVIRRYSDFVWLLDCLHKRYPFRVLPLLPPKRVAVNGNHLSNDGAFIEKRRRGLARFLNALVRHPILSQEQLVVMFLTVPTVSFLSPFFGQQYF
jgi:sorting nexin-8